MELPSRLIFYFRKKRYYLKHNKNQYDPLKPVWVDPQKIEYVTGCLSTPNDAHIDPNEGFINTNTPFGGFKAGNWDQNKTKFSKLKLYKGIKNRFINNQSWENTEFFQEHSKRINSGKISYSSTSVNEFKQKLVDNVDVLYQDIRDSGFKTQKQLHNKPTGEIVVNISREGNLQFNGPGRHRLSIAKILQLDRIPVQILIRHEEHMFNGHPSW